MPIPKSHNLNIHFYKFDEILELFDLSCQISTDDIKRAKKKVLMLHPDKSKLPAEYFLFYKKAYDIVNTFYENQNKQNQPIPTESVEYEHTLPNDVSKHDIHTIVNDMSSSEFQTKFNKLFDDNMTNKPDISKNEWFVNDAPIYDVGETNVNSKNMGHAFDHIRESQSGLIKHSGVNNLFMNSSSGTNIYDTDVDEYVSCDPFGKLKYDDLRKVHKDQTVFVVSERDIKNVTQYTSSDHLMRERSKQELSPLKKEDAEHLLSTQNSQYREHIMQKEYADKLKTMQYIEKNKSVLSNFLRLT